MKKLLAASLFRLAVMSAHLTKAAMFARLRLTAGSGAPAILTDICTTDLLQILEQEGVLAYQASPSSLLANMDDMKVFFLTPNDRKALQAYIGFCSDQSEELEKLNAWNRTHCYSRAYLDDEGDAVLMLDLDMEGGVTRERIVDFIRTVYVSLRTFDEFLRTGDWDVHGQADGDDLPAVIGTGTMSIWKH